MAFKRRSPPCISHLPGAASIGPVTTATLKELGHAPSITAKTHDINGLVEAIVKAAGK